MSLKVSADVTFHHDTVEVGWDTLEFGALVLFIRPTSSPPIPQRYGVITVSYDWLRPRVKTLRSSYTGLYPRNMYMYSMNPE